MTARIKIGVSSCLVGESVRYDGGHKHDRYVSDVLGSYLTLVPVCPEAEAGMGIPREPMSLQGDPQQPRLVTNLTGMDKTEQISAFCTGKTAALAGEDICGFVLKKNSPSCGVHVKVRGAAGERSGSGLFAAALMEAFPDLPLEEEEGLSDLGRRESFIQRVFAYRRWKVFLASGPGLGALVEFHTREKLVVMAHSTSLYRKLGKVVAEGKELPWPLLERRYQELYMEALRLPRTVKKQTNVLQHVMGYFKRQLAAKEKEELASVIMGYHDQLLPVIVPLTLLRHYIDTYDERYLRRQSYLFADPAEVMLLNHA